MKTLKNKQIKTVVIFLIIYILGTYYNNKTIESTNSNKESIESLFINRKSGKIVVIEGQIIKLLTDDLKGLKHQRFIIVSKGFSVLLAHNIDVAQRVPANIGDKVKVKGQYEWNKKGGVIHWTHKDSKKKHPDGWVELNNKKYQ